jgi:ABC-type nitrate/sulfonate/bicarbonate transport system ATPase subunit
MPQAATLEIRDVSKTFPAANGATLTALEHIDLTVAPGEFIGIVGASGCGKSTLLRLIVGLEGSSEGQILLDGAQVQSPGLDRGIVFQEPRLLPWLTMEQNIALSLTNAPISKAEKQDRVRRHIELVQLTGFEQALPHQLSGGMAQRAAIARALVARPQVLLLDEPFGALDALTRAHLQEQLQTIWAQQGVTMVLVTHDVEEATFLSDRVVVLQPRPGRIRRIIDVGLNRPRDRSSPEFAALRRRILDELTGAAPDVVDSLDAHRRRVRA